MERYNIINKLGEGTFGCVWKAMNMENGELVAIKAMKRNYYSVEECLNLPEVKALRKMNHAHIVKLKEVLREHNILYCVFEYMDGSLYQLMKCKGKSFSEDEIKTWCFQVLQGLAYMHHQGYFHRDLKPDNLLVSRNIIKIGDLGSACEINSRQPYTEYITTRWYRAPEVMLQAGVYNSAVDLWAGGAIMAEMFNSSPLFPGSSVADQIHKICSVIGTPTERTWDEGLKRARAVNYQFPQYTGVPLSVRIPSASAEAINLITALCSWDPSKRPTAMEALRHPFFKSCYRVPPSFGHRAPVVKMSPLVTKIGKPLQNMYATQPNLMPSAINYPVMPQMSTTGVPYQMMMNNQGTKTNRNFSKAVARPKPSGYPSARNISGEVYKLLENMSFANMTLGPAKEVTGKTMHESRR